MILRRVIKHVRNQEWTAVFLDFVIVVAGILIAFQITNWSEGQGDAAREQETLIAILEDLKADRNLLSDGLAMAQVNINASNYVLEKAGFDPIDRLVLPIPNQNLLNNTDIKVPESQSIPEAQKSQLWKMIIIHYYPVQSDAAWGTLIAAGDLNIIKNKALVRDLQGYELLWASLENSNNTTYRSLRNQTVFAGQEFGFSPFVHIPEEELFAQLQENPKLVGAMRTLLEFTILHHQQIATVEEAAAILIKQIEEEIML